MMLKIVLVQLEIEDGNKERNLINALDILNRISSTTELPDIVCFPELFTTGYDLKNVKQYAEVFPGKTIEKILNISTGKFSVIGTILEREDDNYYNTAFILDKLGIMVGKYRKVHLFSPMLEKEFLSPGNTIDVFELPSLSKLKVGIAVCYDLRFPEVFRKLALQGAEIIFVPSEFPNPKEEVWRTLLRARAIENQLYIVAINRIGQGMANDFFGASLVTNGRYIEDMGEFRGSRIFSIDLDDLKPIRTAIPLLQDRKPDVYDL
ncbi:MAG: hypothetical protein GF353_22515 [Candidatus Lokiarchaeota archaeon]|nr:hypothetical protein [Candidatus Lokiarchaeota archaeon]